MLPNDNLLRDMTTAACLQEIPETLQQSTDTAPIMVNYNITIILHVTTCTWTWIYWLSIYSLSECMATCTVYIIHCNIECLFSIVYWWSVICGSPVEACIRYHLSLCFVLFRPVICQDCLKCVIVCIECANFGQFKDTITSNDLERHLKF